MEAKKNKDIEVTLEELRRDRKKRKKIKEEIDKMIGGKNNNEKKDN